MPALQSQPLFQIIKNPQKGLQTLNFVDTLKLQNDIDAQK